MTMEKIKDTLIRVLPEAVINHIRNEKDILQRLPQDLKAIFDPVRRDTISSIKKFHNTHKGERCFVIGNGPSLQNTDMTKLRNEYTFGLNRIYLMFQELGFSTSFFVSINDLVIEQSASDIQALDIPKFVSWRSRKWLNPQEDLFFLYTSYTGPKFAKNAAGRLWRIATVTYVMLQLAYYFGFRM
jgi:hypothetical protein